MENSACSCPDMRCQQYAGNITTQVVTPDLLSFLKLQTPLHSNVQGILHVSCLHQRVLVSLAIKQIADQGDEDEKQTGIKRRW